MKCPNCGKDVVEGSKFCDGCGASLNVQSPVVEQNVVNNDVVYYQPPKKSKTGLIVTIVVISVLLITGIVIGIILLTGGSKDSENNENNSNNEYNTINNNSEKEPVKGSLEKNIKYKEIELEDEIILILENNNKEDIYLDAKIEYYDENNTVVDYEDDMIFAFPAGEKTVAVFYKTDRTYKNYEITLEAEKGRYYIAHQKDLKISSRDDKENEEITVTVTNNANVELDTLRVAVLFYKDGKVVGYDYDSQYKVAAGKSFALYLRYPYVGYDKTFEFDNYEIYVEDAFSLNY